MTEPTVASELLKWFANSVILYTGITLLVFIVAYGVLFDWRRTAPGRSVMYFVGALELLIMLAAFLQWLPDLFQEETKQVLRVEVYIAIASTASRMVYVLWRRRAVFNVPRRTSRFETGGIGLPPGPESQG